MEGHAVHDDASYVPKELFEEWVKRDPIERYHRWLGENIDLTDDEDDEIKSYVKRHLNEALERAEASPLPDPASLLDGVYANPEELDTPHHM
jgi:pyruvate dehydrogenase E1 component alpha subunit